MVNRKESPPDEIPGDIFDRQRVIVDFDQPLIERQRCLVLGTGGIGQNVALTLARLGVREIILVDNDEYDLTNLTRQCLGAPSDVGARKVDAAARGLQGHNLRCTITPHHLDVLVQWPEIVKLARRCDVIFNCVDVGPLWDHAINSLAKEFQIPLAAGQSYAWQWMSEFYSSRPENFCASCGTDFRAQFSADNDTKRIQAIAMRLRAACAKLTGDEAIGLDEQQLISFLQEEPLFRLLPTSQTKRVVEKALILHNETRGYGNIDNNNPKNITNALCLTSANVKAFNLIYHNVAIDLLLPGSVSALADLGFLPRPEHPPTRFIGSWVVPCMACSVSMVGQWVNTLTGPTGALHAREIPTMITFKLDEGFTADEAMGYAKKDMFDDLFPAASPPTMTSNEIVDTTRKSLLMDKAERKFSNSPSDIRCGTCAASRLRAAKMDSALFFGTIPVYFERVEGRVDIMQLHNQLKRNYSLNGSIMSSPPLNRRVLASSKESLLARNHHFYYDDDDHHDVKHAVNHSNGEGASIGPVVVTTVPSLHEVNNASPHGGRVISGWQVPMKGSPQYEVSKLQAISRTGENSTEYQNVILPAMPCVEVLPYYRSRQSSHLIFTAESEKKIGGLPSVLISSPLLKAPCSGKVVLEGVASGVRSALVQVETGTGPTWYRLKGCGNNEQGFPVEIKGSRGEVNPRGSCFAHTAHNELYMTSVGNTLLEPLGVTCANASIGAYAYNSSSLGPELCPYPNITRWCALFTTVGDKRLGDHLLAGLEMLLPFFVVPSPSNFNAVHQAIALQRGVDASDELLLTEMCVACEMPLADLYSQALEERSPMSSQDMGKLLDPRWSVLWDSTCRRLTTTLQPAKELHNVGSLLFYLIWRLGWECGVVQRAFTQGGMSWGTYPDSMGIHCNAHANNMVVKLPPLSPLTKPPGDFCAARNSTVDIAPPSKTDPSRLQFLAPLDFDMAFTEETYLVEAGGVDTNFESLLVLERNGFANSLSGSSFISTGVKNTGAIHPQFKSISIAMRDTLVKAFLAACDGVSDPHPVKEELMQPCQDLIRLALCLTSDVVA